MRGFLRWTTAGFVVASLLLSSAASPASAQVNRRDVPIATQPQQRFTVDGTQLEAWASLKSFRCVDAAESDPPEDPGNPTVNFHGERRRNDTHQSTTDPEAMLHRKGKGKEAKLAGLGHVAAGQSDRGLSPTFCATHATGTAERDAAVLLLEASASPGSTVGADKGYDVARFVADVRVQDVTPHVAQKVRGSAIDGRTTRHAGYHVSQRKRKLVEQVFGWMKTVGGLRKLRHRGIALVDWQLTFAATAYNLVRLTESGGEVSLIAGRNGCRWPPRRDSVSPCAPLSGGGVTRMMAMKNSPILVFFSNLLVPSRHIPTPADCILAETVEQSIAVSPRRHRYHFPELAQLYCVKHAMNQ